MTDRFLAVLCAYHRDTYEHSLRVTDYCMKLGDQLGLSSRELSQLKTTALLHDIGKLLIPLEVLSKPGRLSESEMMIMRQHPEYGSSLLNVMGYDPIICEAVMDHHERIDGCGYLGKREIPLYSRIIGVADAYDAMISARPYSPPKTVDVVRTEMIGNAGTQFDDRISALACSLLM